MDSLQNKIKILFKKIIEPNYVMNSYYTDSLINKLADGMDQDVLPLTSMPLIPELIVNIWDKVESAHETVKVFVMRILAIISHNELHFSKIFCKLGPKINQGFKEMQTQNVNISLRVAYMELAIATIQHKTGVNWLIETEVWKEILSMSNDKHTVFVIRKTYKFVSKFVWHLNDCGTEAIPILKNVFGFILKPIKAIDMTDMKSFTSEYEENICKELDPTLQMLISIFTEYKRLKKPNVLIDLIVDEYALQAHLNSILGMIRNNETSLKVIKLVFLILFGRIFQKKSVLVKAVYTQEDFIDMGVWYFNTLHCLISRRNATLVLDYTIFVNVLWSAVWAEDDVTCQKDEELSQLQSKLLFLCLVPALVYIEKPTSTWTNERFNEFILKHVKLNCEHTAKACYALRDMITELDPVSITLQSVKRLTSLKNQLNREQANLVFQVMFYILKEYEPVDELGEEKQNEHYEETEEKLVVLMYVLDMVQSLVKNHDINWQESLEVVCLFAVIYNILMRPNLSCRFVVVALNVMTLMIKKFLPPNLSLLVESQPGTPLHELGKLIYMKMNDLNWEVRDTALELLLVCTEISYIKFPSLQKQIISNNLMNYAATVALHDREYYVQASALKCLGVACRVKSIWSLLEAEHHDIKDLLVAMLRDNQEGIVRKEACNVLCEIYQSQKLTPDCQKTLYEHMIAAALSDFHWEVQLSALKFWRIVIQTILTDQGMLDGTFPPVTFSRETRKIVNLNKSEIQRRLLRTLEKLSEIGCLTVLTKLLQDDTEIEIMETALSISTDLLEILTQYKVMECMKSNDLDSDSAGDVIHLDQEDNTDPVEVMTDPVEDKIDPVEDNIGPLEDNIDPVEDKIDPAEDNKDHGDNRDPVDDGTVPVAVDAEFEASASQENVIEGILNSADVNLLASIYQRQMNIDSKKSNSLLPKVKLLKPTSPQFFVNYLQSKDFKSLIEEKKQWKEGIRSLCSLLDDVLGTYEFSNYEANSLDCY